MSSLINTCSKFNIMCSSLKNPYFWLTELLTERSEDKKIRQSHIAKNLDLTQGTISNYINDPEKLLAQKKKWVIKFIQQFGFAKSGIFASPRFTIAFFMGFFNASLHHASPRFFLVVIS